MKVSLPKDLDGLGIGNLIKQKMPSFPFQMVIEVHEEALSRMKDALWQKRPC